MSRRVSWRVSRVSQHNNYYHVNPQNQCSLCSVNNKRNYRSSKIFWLFGFIYLLLTFIIEAAWLQLGSALNIARLREGMRECSDQSGTTPGQESVLSGIISCVVRVSEHLTET